MLPALHQSIQQLVKFRELLISMAAQLQQALIVPDSLGTSSKSSGLLSHVPLLVKHNRGQQ